jgi:plastocyanin
MKLKRILAAAAVSVFMLGIFSCSKSSGNDGYGGGQQQPPGGGNGGTSSSTINIYNMAFPASTTVKKGTTVKWYNQDGYAHTVTSDDGTSFNSGNLASGATFSYTANTVGSFPYHCNIHSNMNATLIVTE